MLATTSLLHSSKTIMWLFQITIIHFTHVEIPVCSIALLSVPSSIAPPFFCLSSISFSRHLSISLPAVVFFTCRGVSILLCKCL